MFISCFIKLAWLQALTMRTKQKNSAMQGELEEIIINRYFQKQKSISWSESFRKFNSYFS